MEGPSLQLQVRAHAWCELQCQCQLPRFHQLAAPERILCLGLLEDVLFFYVLWQSRLKLILLLLLKFHRGATSETNLLKRNLELRVSVFLWKASQF